MVISEKEALKAYRTATTAELTALARRVTESVHGTGVWVRGLIEFSNKCRRNCLYCGIRRDYPAVSRYAMTEGGIIEVMSRSRALGIESFVLQSGELDPKGTAGLLKLVGAIRSKWPDTALTLSCGTLSRSEYAELKAAGADRYLLRFETSDPILYSRLRNRASLARRLRAVADLKELGYQMGSGFMVGLPGETRKTRLDNALLCKSLELDMVGLGPFIPHPGTPLASAAVASLEFTERITALVRLLLPFAHMPATTASGSLDALGRERMISAGANVLMLNITPMVFRRDYLLYPGKICLQEGWPDFLDNLSGRMKPLGRSLRFGRGDCLDPARGTVEGGS